MAASKKKTKRRTAPAKKAAPRQKTPSLKRVKPRSIELYFWPTSNGLKISIMLEECRLPYEVKPVNINRGEQFAPKFLSISPNNRIPAIVDPDGPNGKPIAIFESGAILQYLGRKTGKFYPKDERGRVEVDSGSSGRSAVSARWRGRRITSAAMPPNRSLMRSRATPMK